MSVPPPVKADFSAQLPLWTFSLLRVWLPPSLQLAASVLELPAVSNEALGIGW